ncbi:MAG: protease SohB [Nevskiaceae bacterium]|nr:MAG: protease SohB [Nevskiaceae bacterium]
MESVVTDFLFQYGLFLAKTVTLVAAVVLAAAGFFALLREARDHGHDRLEIRNINERYESMADTLNHELLQEAEIKQLHKQRKAEEKARQKVARQGHQPPRPRVFALSFDGDLNASPVESLREEISAVLQVARKEDEVLLKLESEGGLVHAYGLAASQLTRIRDRKIRLTVAVDKVAASGGYLMACVADRILAAPFAILGSIGVVAQLPNFHRLLKKNEVDFELHTAGQYKRTLTLFGENTDEARSKFREELEDTHALFKAFVIENRPTLDIEKVATGEHWFGTRALSLRLVDEIKTSDDYLLDRSREADIYEVKYRRRQSLSDRLSGGLLKLGLGLRSGIEKAWPRAI